MPVRHFNYTGRKRLKRDDIHIQLQGENGSLSFNADLHLEEYDLFRDARVFVEAYREVTLMRFEFGTVGDLRAPESRALTEFGSADGVRFRVIVSQDATPRGRLLAEANAIQPRRKDEEEERVPLLPVRSDPDLEHEVFRVDFSDGPLLLVNEKVGDWRELTRHPAFAALAYPSILREILTRVLLVDDYDDVDDADDWRSRWLQYASVIPGAGTIPPKHELAELWQDWIDGTVAAFCRHKSLMNRFANYWEGEGQ